MKSCKTAYVFIDTNIALHYKRSDQIDWPMLTNANEVVLIAAPFLLRELEKQKVLNPSSKLKKRAREYITWLRQFKRDPNSKVRVGVRWLFLTQEPLLDFEAEGLSKIIADDHLIASVIYYTRETGISALVATADSGLQFKLEDRGIEILEIPEDMQLPDEPDPLENENKLLKQKIKSYESRMPHLSVEFEGGTQHFTLPLHKPDTSSVVSLDEIRADNPHIPDLQAPSRPQNAYDVLITEFPNLSLGVTTEQERKYKEDLELFFSLYQHYVEIHAIWREMLDLHHMVKLVIANDSSASASKIDIDLIFPEIVRVVEKDEFPEEPKVPKAPTRLQGIADVLRSAYRCPPPLIESLAANNFSKPIIQDGYPIVDKDGNCVRISYSTLKHHKKVTSEGIRFRFEDVTTVQPFKIRYRLSAELLDLKEGELHFRIDAPDT